MGSDIVSTAQSQGQIQDIATPLQNPWLVRQFDRIVCLVTFNPLNTELNPICQ